MTTSRWSVEDLDLNGQTVLMRVDFNVPITEGRIDDDTRIKAALESIRYVLERECPLILMSHLGRPKGRVDHRFSLKPVAVRLSQLLGRSVTMSPDWLGRESLELAVGLKAGEILMLENTRFDAVEEGKDGVLEDGAKRQTEAGGPHAEVARKSAAEARQRLKVQQRDAARGLAGMADVFINDAFGTVHRRHVSTAIVAEHVDRAAIGFLMKRELKVLDRILREQVERPIVAIVGGLKVSDKLGVLHAFLDRADTILIGGAMAYTFMRAQRKEIGASFYEEALVDEALDILKKAGTTNGSGRKRADVFLPVDHLAAEKPAGNEKLTGAEKTTHVTDQFSDCWMGVDIGSETIRVFSEKIRTAGTIVWNGPMGVFEIDSFAKGTRAIAEAVGRSNTFSVVGGGDSVKAINRSSHAKNISHISTGGGAMLDYLSGRELPGLANIPKREHNQQEIFTCRGLPARGFAFSSTKACLRAAGDLYLEGGLLQKTLPPRPASIAERALKMEKAVAGVDVAANDVTPIMYGGVVQVDTNGSTGEITHEAIDVDQEWLSSHVVVAYRHNGKTHHNENVLRKLVDAEDTPKFVEEISGLSRQMREALALGQGHHDGAIVCVAELINTYRQIFFERWGEQAGLKLIHPEIVEVASELLGCADLKVVAWKPPGAGAASSIISVTSNAEGVIDWFKHRPGQWTAHRAAITRGLSLDPSEDDQTVTFSAGGRIDLIGAADLGVFRKASGTCISMAIGPRSKYHLKF